jgi:hypothetical protein
MITRIVRALFAPIQDLLVLPAANSLTPKLLLVFFHPAIQVGQRQEKVVQGFGSLEQKCIESTSSRITVANVTTAPKATTNPLQPWRTSCLVTIICMA